MLSTSRPFAFLTSNLTSGIVAIVAIVLIIVLAYRFSAACSQLQPGEEDAEDPIVRHGLVSVI